MAVDATVIAGVVEVVSPTSSPGELEIAPCFRCGEQSDDF
jgi:hypothetical protein